MPWRIILEAHATAPLTDGNVATATLCVSGTGASLRVISVIIPRVPSEPVKRAVRLYPADVLLFTVRELTMRMRGELHTVVVAGF